MKVPWWCHLSGVKVTRSTDSQLKEASVSDASCWGTDSHHCRGFLGAPTLSEAVQLLQSLALTLYSSVLVRLWRVPVKYFIRRRRGTPGMLLPPRHTLFTLKSCVFFVVFSTAGILHERCNTRLMAGKHTSSLATVTHTSVDCNPIWMEFAAVGKGRWCCSPHAYYSKLATSASSFLAGLCTHCLSLKSSEVVKLGKENFFPLNDNWTDNKITKKEARWTTETVSIF